VVVAGCRRPIAGAGEPGVRLEAGGAHLRAKRIAGLVERLDGLRSMADPITPAIVERTKPGAPPMPESAGRQFEVERIAPLELTSALLGQLHPGAKVILMTSAMGSYRRTTLGRLPTSYRMSKVGALACAGKSMGDRLRKARDAVDPAHPAWGAPA